jgi:hypothetical protein
MEFRLARSRRDRGLFRCKVKAGREPGSSVHFLLVMLGNPIGDCPLQRRAFVLALQFPKRLAAEVRDVRLLSFSLAVVTRNVHVFSQVPTGAMLPPVIARRRDRFSGSLLLRLTH